MIHTWVSALARGFRRTALPLACYYAVTLVVPLAHGAARADAFVPHAVVVLLVPPVLIVFVSTIHTMFMRGVERLRRAPHHRSVGSSTALMSTTGVPSITSMGPTRR
jgi:hypothetical protein